MILDSRGRVTRLSKAIDPKVAAGESIGIQKIGGAALGRLWPTLDDLVRSGRTNVFYEEGFQRMIDSGTPFGVVPVSSAEWTENESPDFEDGCSCRPLTGREGRGEQTGRSRGAGRPAYPSTACRRTHPAAGPHPDHSQSGHPSQRLHRHSGRRQPGPWCDAAGHVSGQRSAALSSVVLDCCDGQLARARVSPRPPGPSSTASRIIWWESRWRSARPTSW